MPRIALTFDPGTRFGNWTVLGPGKLIDGRYTSSSCQCACGITRLVKNTFLAKGRSLGCGHVTQFQRGQSSRKKLDEGIAARNAALYHIKKSAVRRGLQFELSDSEALEMMSQPCFWCGKSNVNLSSAKNYNGSYRYNGIDRLNNEKGYIQGNAVPCCGPCNKTKNTMNKKEFIDYCILIAVKHGSCTLPLKAAA